VTTSESHTELAYDLLLPLGHANDDVVVLLREIRRRDVDVDDLLNRWDREHMANVAGRLEARVYELGGGGWRAEPFIGLAPAQVFDTEAEARAWIATGGHR
jgi:hypothetical protein